MIERIGRGARIRTADLLRPRQARYQAAPRPERPLTQTLFCLLFGLTIQQRKLLFILPSFPSAVQPESSRALSSHAGRGPVRADPTCVHGSNCSRQQRGRHLPSPKIAHTLQPHGGIRCTCTVPAHTFFDFRTMLIGECGVQCFAGELLLCFPTRSSGALTERRTGAF